MVIRRGVIQDLCNIGVRGPIRFCGMDDHAIPKATFENYLRSRKGSIYHHSSPES